MSSAARCRRTILSLREAVVVDASVMVDMLVDHPELGVHLDGRALHAPVTIDAEVLHALRRRWIRDELTSVDVRSRLDLFTSAALQRHSVVTFIHRMWDLRHNVTPPTSRSPNR